MNFHEKWNKAILAIQYTSPCYLRFMGLMTPEECEDPEVTARVNMVDDYVAKFEYNPAFVEQLSYPSLAALVVTALNRMLLQHCTTRLLPNGSAHLMASTLIAADASLNAFFLQERTTNDLGKYIPSDNDPSIKPILGESYDPAKDKFLEHLYNCFNKSEQFKKMCQGGGDGDPSDGSNGADEGDAHEKEKNAIKKHFSPKNIKTAEKWGKNSQIKAQIQAAVRGMKTSDWGNMPAGLRDSIVAANMNVIDPRQPLKRFIATAMSEDMEWDRLHYPIPYGDEYIGKIPGTRYSYRHKLLIAIDSSGSMYQNDLKLAVSAVNQFVKAGSEVEYCWWDCESTLPAKAQRKINKAEVSGGGGTDPNCVIEMLHKNHLEYDGLIFITDNGFSWSRPNEFRKIFIIKTSDATKSPEWCRAEMSMQSYNAYMNREQAE